MRSAGFTRLMLVAVFLPAAVAFAQTQDLSRMPAKIEVTNTSINPVKGESITIHIKLLDAENRPAVANKDFEIEIEGHSQNGTVERSKTLVKAGETGQTMQLALKDAGVTELTASNKQLAQGGTVLNVRASGSRATPPPSMAATPSATAEPNVRSMLGVGLNVGSSGLNAKEKPTPAPQHPGAEATRHAYRARPASELPEVAMAGPPPPLPREEPSPVTATPSPSTQGSAWTPNIKLNYYPKRALRADEKDAATIYAYLPPDDPAHDDMLIYLSSDIGPPNPAPLKIPKGGTMGQATLVTGHPAAIQLWYQWSTPAAKAPDPPLTIKFSPPVWALRIVPSSPRIGLFESTEIGIELVDSHGISVPADEERPVYLSIGSGTGQLEKGAVKFDSGSGRVASKFIPTWPGAVRLVATTPYLQDASTTFTVATPFWLLLFCALGGALGGLVAFWTEKPAASWQRIPIGLITGFVLYWAFLFGVVSLSSFPHGFLLNPFPAAILSLIGGWIGTKVFTILLKPLGLQW